jgi:hypothetical protein
MGECSRLADGQYPGLRGHQIAQARHGFGRRAGLFCRSAKILARRIRTPPPCLDAGLSDVEGLGCFVMAFVEGVPIDEAAQGRTMAQKLDLFFAVYRRWSPMPTGCAGSPRSGSWHGLVLEAQGHAAGLRHRQRFDPLTLLAVTLPS